MGKIEQRARDIVEELRADINFELDDVIFKIVGSLPDDYFKSLSRKDQLTQLKALLAMGVCKLDQEIMLRSDDGLLVGVISRQNYPGLLADILERLPRDKALVGAKIFTSTDHNFIIDLFEFHSEDRPSQKEPIPDSEIAVAVNEAHHRTGINSSEIRRFIEHYPANSSILRSPGEIAEHLLAYRQMAHANDIVVRWCEQTRGESRITISAGSSRTRELFERTAAFLGDLKLDIEQAFLLDINRNSSERTALASFHVYGRIDDDVLPSASADQLRIYLRLDREVITRTGLPSLFEHHEDAEVAVAVSRLVGHLMKFSGNDVSFQEVKRIISNHYPAMESVASVIRNEPSNDSVSISLNHLNNPLERKILSTLDAIKRSITTSNYHLDQRRTLTLRLDSNLFCDDLVAEKPFAVFYVFGDGFDGFHVRFREVARGGMRLVRTRNQEHYLIESVRGLEEAYRLASAQQLKNKDIAEGGAKATIILKPGIDPDRAGRDFVDGLLDIVLQESTNGELLYLGPDENVTPEFIEWVVQRSRDRGYPYPESLMSSKPKAGINHKEFGVTSEGVTVFMKRALRFAGIDATNDSFTIKLTGGPDGDVAGNEIRILIRDFGERVKFIGLADGTGSAVDLNGLDHSELLRLVHHSKPICEFCQDKLSHRGSVSGLESMEAIARRNDLQFNIQTDVFIPAGGRPSTINADNWTSYFNNSGEPAAAVIVEGANLFIDDIARNELSKRGVVIVKDSSANKCGVICSSLEIIAGMLMNEETFLAIKPRFVNEVLDLLRELADIEAICLFNEQPRAPDVSLPELSVLISKLILHLGDLIFSRIDAWSQQDIELAKKLVTGYLPASLIEQLGPELVEDIPQAYCNQLVAAILSSRVVYREGYQNLRNMRDDNLAKVALDHLRFENETLRFIDDIKTSGVEAAEAINKILRYSGSKALRELGGNLDA